MQWPKKQRPTGKALGRLGERRHWWEVNAGHSCAMVMGRPERASPSGAGTSSGHELTESPLRLNCCTACGCPSNLDPSRSVFFPFLFHLLPLLSAAPSPAMTSCW